MISRIKIMMLASIVLLLTSCAQINSCKLFQNIQRIEPTTIQGFYTILGGLLATHWISGTIIAIDQKPVNYPLYFINSYASYKIFITPNRPHTITVQAYFNRHWGGIGPFSAIVPLRDIVLQPNTAYKINGKVEGPKVILWVEKKLSGEEISPNFSSTYFPPLH